MTISVICFQGVDVLVLISFLIILSSHDDIHLFVLIKLIFFIVKFIFSAIFIIIQILYPILSFFIIYLLNL